MLLMQLPSLSQINIEDILFSDEVLITLIVCAVVILVSSIYGTICRWFMFKKAGTKGWFSIIPFYRIGVLSKLAGYKAKKAIWYYIPIAHIVYLMMLKYNISVRFGYNVKMTVLYMFLPPVALSFFAFKAKYTEQEGDPGVVKKVKVFEDQEVDPFRDFKPELNPNAVEFEEVATAYSAEEAIVIDPNSVKLELIDSDLVKEDQTNLDDIPDPTLEELRNPNLKRVEFEKEMEAYERPLTNEEKYYMAREKEQKEAEIITPVELEPQVVMIPNGVEIDDMQIGSNSNSVLSGIELSANSLQKESKRDE